MNDLISDRRLYLTEDGDAVVEEGDTRSRFLLSGKGSTIPAAEVNRLGLEVVDGRIAYPGVPKPNELTGEADAKQVEAEDRRGKVLQFGGDKTGGRDKVDPPGEPGTASVGRAPASAESDSDRNDGDVPEWTQRTSPEAYLERYPDGPNAELAKAVIAAREAGADGGS